MTKWRKGSRSGGGTDDACVELAEVSNRVLVRDSKDPEGDRLMFERSAFAALLARLKRGELGL